MSSCCVHEGIFWTRGSWWIVAAPHLLKLIINMHHLFSLLHLSSFRKKLKALITSVTHYAFWVILRFTYNYRQKLGFIIMPFVLSQLSFTLQVWYQQLLNGILTYWAKYDGMRCLLLLRQPAESYEGIEKLNVRSQVTLFWIVSGIITTQPSAYCRSNSVPLE